MRFNSFDMTLGGKLQLFSVYTDFGAYRRVRSVAHAIAKLAGQRWQCPSEMWKLDSFIANGPIKRMVASDGANADVLIVVVGSLEQRRPELMEWLESLIPLEPGRTGLLVGVLGDDDDKGVELDWTARQLIQCAQKTNRRFVWHWMQHHDGEDSDWLAESIEALLAHKRSLHPQVMMPEAAVA